jgi:hypothetical protein
MKALIDADVLLYECSSIAEAREATKTEEARKLKSFDFVKEVFDGRVRDIMAATGSDVCTLYLTGPGNFREDIAISKKYKGTRKEEKPYHYLNLKAYIMGLPNCQYIEGMEADDAMSIEQMYWYTAYENHEQEDLYTVICTRDKDLRMVPGWHYGWECGKQPEYRLRIVEYLGEIALAPNRKSIKGTGLRFFWAQMLTGDTVDNIPGLKGWGPVGSYAALEHCYSEHDCCEAVKDAYQMAHPEDWEAHMLEQGRLLWMVRELDDEGKPVMWEIPDD